MGQTSSVIQAAANDSRERSLLVRAKGLLEFGAAAGILMFTVLSVMYDEFYGSLGLEPEDVGLTQTVIVQRALAGVLLVAGAGLVVLLVFVAARSVAYLAGVTAEWMTQKFLSDDQRAWLQKFREKRLAKWLTALYFVPGVSEVPPPPWKHRQKLAIAAGLLVVAALALTFTVGWSMVKDASQKAKGGETVYPLTFAGIRILDIESRPCQVRWLGDREQMPDELSNGDLHCLGSANGFSLFRIPEVTVRVPASLVSTTF